MRRRLPQILLLAVINIVSPGFAQERPEMIIPPPQRGLIRPQRPAEPPARQRQAVPRPQASVPARPGPVRPAPELAKPPVPVVLEKPMLDLSETIGALAFLSELCSPTATPNPWQMRMEGLIDSEGEALGNKERLIGAYNQGYLSFSTTYRQCTEAAGAARSLLTRDASRLAREIERRFGT